MSDISTYSLNRILAESVNEETYVGVDNLLQRKAGKTTSAFVPRTGTLTKYVPNDILIGNIRPYLQKIWLADRVGGCSGDVLVIRTLPDDKDTILPKFLYFLLSSNRFFRYAMQFSKGSKMPRGDKKAIMNYLIPIPSLDEQSRIVSILDRFDALVNDLKDGLPAEIAARRKQYECYRDQLLTFKPLKKEEVPS